MERSEALDEIKIEVKQTNTAYVTDYAYDFIRRNKHLIELIARGVDVPYEELRHNTEYHFPGMTYEEAMQKQRDDSRHMKSPRSLYMTMLGYNFVTLNVERMHILGLGVRVDPATWYKVEPFWVNHWRELGRDKYQERLFEQGKPVTPEFAARMYEKDEGKIRKSFKDFVGGQGRAKLDAYVSKGLMAPKRRDKVLSWAYDEAQKQGFEPDETPGDLPPLFTTYFLGEDLSAKGKKAKRQPKPRVSRKKEFEKKIFADMPVQDDPDAALRQQQAASIYNNVINNITRKRY